MKPGKWYNDPEITTALPLRYRAYAAYSRLFGDASSRQVPGGSFLLRALRKVDRLASRNTVAPINGVDGLVVMTDLADERVLEVIHEIRGENPEYRVMKALLSGGDTFIDIGANFGTFSLLASRLVGDTGEVFAVEPQPRLADLIEESARRSEAGNVSIVRAACSDAAGVTLIIPDNDTGRAGLFPGFSGVARHTSLSVPAVTLDQVGDSIRTGRQVLAKIDAEGSELAILQSGRSFLKDRQPALIIEINPWSARAAGFSPREIVDELVNAGYNRFAYAHDYPRNVEAATLDLEVQSNIVATFEG